MKTHPFRLQAIAAYILAAIMLLLGGCNSNTNRSNPNAPVNNPGKPIEQTKTGLTAEDLLTGGLADIDSCEIITDLTIDMTTPMPASGDDAGQITGDIDVLITSHVSTKSDGDIRYSTGNMTVSMLDMEIPQKTEQWDNSEHQWSYDERSGAWTKSLANRDSITDNIKIAGASQFNELSLSETNDTYVITGKITEGPLADSMKKLLRTMSGDDTLPIELDITMTTRYDKDTQRLLTANIVMQTGSDSTVVIKSASIDMQVTNVGEISLTLPDDLP